MSQILHGIIKDETFLGLPDKKRKGKDTKDTKKKDASSPANDRIPLPFLPEAVIVERRNQNKEMGKKNPPSVCLYTILNAPGGVCSAALSENCEMAAVGYGNSLIQVHTLNQKGLPSIKPSSDLEHFELDAEGEVHDEIYDSSAKADVIDFSGHVGPVYSLSYSPDRRLLLSGSRDETVRLWSFEMRRNLMVYRMDAPVLRSQFCNRGFYFAVSTASKLVSLYSSERIHPLRIFANSQDDVTALDFHPNANYVIGGSEDHQVYVWDVLTANCVRKFSGHKSAVHSVKAGSLDSNHLLQVSPDGRYVVSASLDGIVNVWDLATQKLVCTQECAPMPYQVPIVFSKDSATVAIASPEFAVSFYNLDVVSASESSEQRLNPEGFHGFTYPTKRTSLLDFLFSRKNTVIGIGSFEQ